MTASVMTKPRWSSQLHTDSLTIVQVIAASLCIGLCAQISVPLFFSPVPLTLQTLAILMIGAVLGPKKGAASVVLYLMEGAMGLPVFANGGFGILNLIGPRGGYLIGSIFQAYLSGWIVQKNSSLSSVKVFAGLLGGCALQMGLGVFWLSRFVGWESVLLMGFYPFIPGEVLKCLAFSKVLKPIQKFDCLSGQ